MNKEQIIQTIKKYNLNSNEYIVLEDSSLVLQGLKETTDDIDIAVSEECFEYLFKKYECEQELENTYIIDNVINFGKNYYNKDEVVYVESIPVQNLDSIKKMKLNFKREKDLKDLALIDKYLGVNSLVLAYLGDAVYEIYIRQFLINKGFNKVNNLQKEAIKYVSAKGQCKFITKMLEDKFLTEEEQSIFYRARNYKSNSHPKNTDIITYKYATGFEAVIGYLKLKNDNKRIEDIINYCLEKGD